MGGGQVFNRNPKFLVAGTALNTREIRQAKGS